MDERERIIERVFHEALERTPGERAEFVASHAPDESGAALVLELLACYAAAGPGGAVDAALRPAGDEIRGALEDLGIAPMEGDIGPYRIERILGRGGFGVVYLAEQRSSVRRRVALKIVKRGMDTEEVVRRFEVERQALAMLDHPGIAKIYDAGITPDGRPYFAMEYVPGVTFCDYCDAERLATDARLRLFVAVCDAVQHAHEKGILHRDLKPSNILVRVRGGEPSPVVIDFGLAKAMHQPLTDGGHLTRDGAFVGTPEFASPEQLRSDGFDADTRSDVYSLGAVLFLLLTGELPADAARIRERISSSAGAASGPDDPPAPSRKVSSSADSSEAARLRGTEPRELVRRLRGDLDAIALKALAPERKERYASVSELAADIERHLANEPVLAAPPSVAYRARKFVRRHRGAVAAAAALALTLVLGIAGTATGWLRAARELERAEAARESALAELRVSNAIQAHLTDVLGAANPWARGGLPGVGRETKVVDALALAATRAGDAFEGLPVIEGAVRRTIGENYQALGLSEEAEAQLRIALELMRTALGEDAPATVRVKATLAAALQGRGQYAESARLRETVLAWYRAHDAGNHVAILDLERDLANIATLGDRFEAAEPALRDVVRRAVELLGPDHVTTRRARFDLAALAYARGEVAEALELLEAAHASYVAEAGAGDPETIDAGIALGGVLVAAGRKEEAYRILESAVADATRLLGEPHPVTLGAINNLGLAYQRSGDLDRAEPLLRRAVEIGSAARGALHPNTLEARANLGLLQRRRGDLANAEKNLSDCWTASLQAKGPQSLDAAEYELYFAYVLHDLARFDDADEHFERVIRVRSEVLGEAHPEATVARNRYGESLLERGELSRAEEVLTRALADGLARLPKGHDTVVTAYELLIALREAQGRSDEREAHARDLAAWTGEGPPGPAPPPAADSKDR